jgi:predicted nucleic acid-binding protein
MMRVVLDSNVILSGLMSPKGTTGQIIQAWKVNQFVKRNWKKLNGF